jgi:hypothetical protein
MALFAKRISLCVVCMTIAALPARADLRPIALYGENVTFDVLRDGIPVGSHTVSFSRDEASLLVETQFEIAIKFLIFTAYTLDYSSKARWREGKLIVLEARTDDDGEIGLVKARRSNGLIRITGPDGSKAVTRDLFPTNHWNVAVTESAEVLNTITGQVNKVRMRNLGLETITAEGIEIEARRWAYTGDLQNEVWYDDKGRWVKMRFAGKDGSLIEYVCTKCLGGGNVAAHR